MARMPGALWRPLAANWASQPRMRAYDFFCLHTMVGSLDGTDGYFKVGNGTGYGGTESHFGVGPDGTIYQWQDTAYQADANGDGNWHVISSENADTGFPFPKWGGSDVPAFTPQQIEANARIAAWLNEVHGIPLDLTPDSKPGRRGLAVHRWGVPGYMVAGAEQWSSSQGKACPGDRRTAQAPQVSARAKQIRNGDDDMALFTNLAAFKQAVYEATWGFKWTVPGTTEKKNVGGMLMDSVVNARAARVDAAVARKLAEESATRGAALSDADVQRIAEQTAAEVAEDLSEGYDLTATPKSDEA